jgi:hypothetical protein
VRSNRSQFAGIDRQLSDALASCSENRMATAAEIAASINSIFGDDSPADKKGGLLQE